jgi:VanZ family protein
MNKILDSTFLLAYCLLVYWLSDQPSLHGPQWFPHQDKLYHAGIYSIMALLAWRSFRHWIGHPIILAISAIAFCSLYGIHDEWHQSFVEGRTADLADWIADTAGAAATIFLFYKLRIRPQVRIKL